MKKFSVSRQYASVSYLRKGIKMQKQEILGVFEAETPYEAVKQAAHRHFVPAILLHAEVL